MHQAHVTAVRGSRGSLHLGDRRKGFLLVNSMPCTLYIGWLFASTTEPAGCKKSDTPIQHFKKTFMESNHVLSASRDTHQYG
jgi:hypothetical protein